jgi:hypothetical protein
LTPNSFAFFNFDPEFSPVTSISVDLLIDETTFAPSFSAFVFASALDSLLVADRPVESIYACSRRSVGASRRWMTDPSI